MLNMITNLLKLLLIISLLSACNQSIENKQNRRAKSAQLVIAVPVEMLSLSSQQHVSGSLRAIQTVMIFNQESGQIDKLPYFQGDYVKQGEILVYIKNDKIAALLAKSKATHAQTKSDLNRLAKLSKNNLTSQDELSQARTALALAKAQESINQIRLNDTFIKAPFTGVISERLHEPGDIVPLHTHILSLINNTKLNVKIQVSELLLSKLLLNSKVSIKIDALVNSDSITGYISRIYPTIDPITRKGTLEVELDSVPMGAKPGQLCRITIHTPKTERLLLDAAAIQYNDSGKFVFRVNEDNRVVIINVKTGIQINNKIEILSGLEVNNLIVIEGFSNLKSGKKVKVANRSNNLNSKDLNAKKKVN